MFISELVLRRKGRKGIVNDKKESDRYYAPALRHEL